MLHEVKKNDGFCEQNETLITSRKYKAILVEWAILAIHPQSFLVGKKMTVFNHVLKKKIFYHLNDYLSLLSILKNAYILKILLQKNFSGSSRTRRIWYVSSLIFSTLVRCLDAMLISLSLFEWP